MKSQQKYYKQGESERSPKCPVHCRTRSIRVCDPYLLLTLQWRLSGSREAEGRGSVITKDIHPGSCMGWEKA